MLRRTLLYALPLACLFIGTTLVYDPASIFRLGYETRVVNIVLNGKNADKINNFDDRRFQQLHIEKTADTPKIVGLGSSRLNQLESQHVCSTDFFNYYVVDGVLEDYMALTELMIDNGGLPEHIVLGVDPWLMNDNHGKTKWARLSVPYYQFAQRLAQSNATDIELNELITADHLKATLTSQEDKLQFFSIAYFREAWRYAVQNRLIPAPNPAATDDHQTNHYVKRKDGSLGYPDWLTNLDPTELAIKVDYELYQVRTFTGFSQLDHFTELDPQLTKIFEQYIAYLQTEGVALTFYISPYHPTAYEFFETTDHAPMAEWDAYIRDFAAQNNIPVYGTLDPLAAGLTTQDFVDHNHTFGYITKLVGNGCLTSQ